LSSRAIAILVGDIAHLDRVTSEMNDNALRLAERFWPGPLTLVVPKHQNLPEILSQNQTVGVRMPDHPVALMILKAIGPLAVTSANLSGGENPNTAQDVLAQLDGRIHLILDGGRTPGGVPSTVLDCTAGELSVLRPGPLSIEDIKIALVKPPEI
jgi:L-threonylcarbamoyladenylate synthase